MVLIKIRRLKYRAAHKIETIKISNNIEFSSKMLTMSKEMIGMMMILTKKKNKIMKTRTKIKIVLKIRDSKMIGVMMMKMSLIMMITTMKEKIKAQVMINFS